nr:putative reverse transcriptase domain-containing protein [Tanacetum cinerariifolium]
MTGPPTNNQQLAKLLAQIGTLGIKNTGTPTQVAFYTGPTPYVGPLTVDPSTVSPSIGLVYPPRFPQPANYTYTADTVGPNSPIPPVYFMPSAQPTGLLSPVQLAPPAQQVNLIHTGDLYQVTAPSLIPHAFLVSQHTWHQRLGHPGGEVLRRLVFSNFISYNKEKPPVLCHAYVWTSPIPCLSVGYKSIERDHLMVIGVMVAMDTSSCSHFSNNEIDDGTISKFPGYHSSEEEPTEQSRALNKYGFVDHPELQRNEFALHRLPQQEGNMNGWLIKDEDEPLEHEASDKEVDSDLESTLMVENDGNNGCTYKGFMACNPKEYDRKRGAITLTRWIAKIENVIDNSGCAENQKVKYAASSFVNKALTGWNTQVQARGHEAAIGMPWADFKALLVEEFYLRNEMEKLESDFWNHKMVGANHVGYTDRFHELAKLVLHLVTPESSRIKRAGILTDEAVSCGTLTKGNKKRKGVEESRKQGGGRNDDKRAKVRKGFVALTTYRNEYVGSLSKCAKCLDHHPKDRPCLVCFNCQKPGHIARNYRLPINQVAPINAVRGGYKPGTCYECGSREHYRNTWRAFNVNAVGALQDPNIMTSTFSLNHHYATVLFDSGADFSFISTSFAPLLNEKSSFVNPGYLIEVADGKKVEVDTVIRNYKLELGTSLFTIDLIPLGHGSFDVIVGMDWLSEHKAKIVCHEKVVRIPLESGEILIVQGERITGIAKALSNMKVDEPKLSDIFVVRDFVEVFPKDLSGLSPQRQVEFRIDLVSGATLVAKSPYHLAPSEMQKLFAQLQELQDKVYSKSKDEHEVYLRLVLELLKNEELYAKFSKCGFWLQEVRFLGHVVNQSGIHVDPSKIETVKNWKAPTKPSEIRSFLRHYLYGTKSVIYTNHKSLQHIFDQKELNMRQRRWIELFSDYECEIRYHPVWNKMNDNSGSGRGVQAREHTRKKATWFGSTDGEEKRWEFILRPYIGSVSRRSANNNYG